MKNKILTFSFTIVLFYSCGTKKASTSTVSAASVNVAETPLTKELAEGKSLYENSCASCHKLYSRNSFSKEEWKPIVNRMQGKAKITTQEAVSIYNYLTSN